IQRSINATWQEYQSTGLLGGMAHAADLPRQLILSALNSFVSPSFLRYLWTFSMLTIGPLGVYMLAYHTLLKRFGSFTRRIAYFSLFSASTTVNATQNLVATPEIIARNHEFGSFTKVALLEGFWFKYADLSPNNQFQFLLGPWINHIGNPAIQAIGFAFFAMI